MVTQPYHRRLRPTPQDSLLLQPKEISLIQYARCLGSNTVIGMAQKVGLTPPPPPISVRHLLDLAGAGRNFNRIDLTSAHLPPYPMADPSGALPDSRPLANSLFDRRAAAAINAAVGDPDLVTIETLLEKKEYPQVAPTVFILTPNCLAAMAYMDYFPGAVDSSGKHYGESLRAKVSGAIMRDGTGPGWCGTMGPDIDVLGPHGEGNYDFTQMFILPLVYSFYDELPEAREQLINLLLARGRVHRWDLDDILTSGGAPNDWSRAGYVTGGGDIPETENHVLLIATARYLTNQLLYQRDHDPNHDNRRNGDHEDSRPNCMDQVLDLLRNYLRDDFAEYNAKNYQEETRHALLNLCSYAYDAEVRLGARMVLDYISAHIAVSSNDLRRMVPFRRRNEGINVQQNQDAPGFMDVSLLDAHGADPMPAQFALLAGNTRAYQRPNFRVWPGKSIGDPPEIARPWCWAITPNFGTELTLGALSDYRLPPSIHDLFVNDLHRRFFQRIHRHPLEEPGQQRNCDNMEIYAGSPSYLITAGGKPATWVIPGRFGIFGYQDQNLGVAVPTSFMPTSLSAGPNVSTNDAKELIQLSTFSADSGFIVGTENYGVAPDFACGFGFYLPAWTLVPDGDGRFTFNSREFQGDGLAGFFLGIIKEGSFILIEALDTWHRPGVEGIDFGKFDDHVRKDNKDMRFRSAVETVYTTFFGNRIHFVIWDRPFTREGVNIWQGSRILNIEYSAGDPFDTLVDAGNYTDESQFLSGNILQSAGDAVTEIHNPSLGTKITLDWRDRDPPHLMRTAEDGEVEHAGRNEAGQWYEVWLDFDWSGDHDGDFYHPFNTLADALAAVADGGTIRIAPGTTSERSPIGAGKRIKLVAPIGRVTIGGS